MIYNRAGYLSALIIKRTGEMRNKILTLLTLILLCMLITGCADSTSDAPVETPQPAAPDEAPPAATPALTPEPGDTPIVGSRRTPEERAATPVDVDLTVLTATMLSAEINNIYANGEDFMGKTIRVSGTYGYIPSEELGIQYHYVVTLQGDSCCQEGFEFLWNGDHVFPYDYPQVGTPIEVDGVFGTYEEYGYYYYYLAIDDIFILG